MTRTYGDAQLKGTIWSITGEPHVLMMFKRVFPSLARQFTKLHFQHTPSNAELLEWMMARYPLRISERDGKRLATLTEETRGKRSQADFLLKNGASAGPVDTLIPLRDYQLQAVHLLRLRNALLVGDDLGLGKTSIALGAIAYQLQPAIIVCKTHLQQQWTDEANKFLKGVKVHRINSTKHYDLPEHNLLIITYSKLASWAEYLTGYQLIAFDEVQELRRAGTKKYEAAEALCKGTPFKLGLTATPVYNYGDEIFNIIDLLVPNVLGSLSEFLQEWCTNIGMHYKVINPHALGSFLAENHLFLRRRRSEVGRELPPVTKISEEVEFDGTALLASQDHALQLAKKILRGSWEERGKAALELDALLRMQTGLAKAPFVAAFVKQLVEAGESVVLVGWHRDVYTVWQRAFASCGITSRLYTGSESPNQKAQAAKEFVEGFAQVLVLSLRSGEGLNGLQNRASVIVFGELDWSPQVHEQCIGRLNRDGQANPVTAVYLYAGGGSDPVIAATLGIKRSQSEGIINPMADSSSPADGQAETARAAALARDILARVSHQKPEIQQTCIV